MLLEWFKLVCEINFFIFPISAGFLTYRKIHGKPGGRVLRLTITSGIILILSWIGFLINHTPEQKEEMIKQVEQSLSE